MRADAARRRQNIITHAKHVFAQRGGDVALEAVAAASGVGIATLYRNFPSRDDLVRAVVQDMVEQIIQAVDQVRSVVETDPAAAWEDLLSSLTAMELGALTDGLALQAGSAHTLEATPLAQVQQPAVEALNGVLAELKTRGAVRESLTALDVIVAVATITRPQVSPIRGAAPGVPAQLAEAYLLWTRAGREDAGS
ncbi:TetR/AcrR family transcriptional regulator [Arthrobacter caoxuetaonis]|uniref:TetR/AcrR family transcriptional regulator n=1 Tax=Arthrobacter caoxuetaonis TaxID=2886935 RepID=A0A9X1MD91_9MICC|nr:TetR/AcrR family transcriptional regulator [Arthrobacter caoxuetaonis]MCC3296659.1 TetR/AcrR family transcriptional regulator [Arthrobacter caoxuetaonis]USQ56515.1 TetR/AcrR family transcriptional regulator [Arthrobacter caoxuetaonis]